MRLETFTLAQLRQRAKTPTGGGDIVKGIIPGAGLVLFVGPANSGKTRTLSCIATEMQVEEGGVFAGRAVQPGRVIFCALERTNEAVCDLFDAAARGASDIPTLLGCTFIRRLRLDDEQEIAELAQLADNDAVAMIVVDTLRAATAMDESRSSEAALLREACRTLGSEQKRVVVLVHHTDKNGHRPRGSTDFEAMADTLILVRGRANGLEATLDVRHHGAAGQKLGIRFLHGDGHLSVDAVGVEKRRSDDGSNLAVVVDLVRENPDMGKRQLREAVRETSRLGNAAIDVLIDKALRQGVIRNTGKPGKHKYCVTEENAW